MCMVTLYNGQERYFEFMVLLRGPSLRIFCKTSMTTRFPFLHSNNNAFPKQECFRSSFSTKFASIDINTFDSFENNNVTITINKFLTNSSPPWYFELLGVTSGRGFPLPSITQKPLWRREPLNREHS